MRLEHHVTSSMIKEFDTSCKTKYRRINFSFINFQVFRKTKDRMIPHNDLHFKIKLTAKVIDHWAVSVNKIISTFSIELIEIWNIKKDSKLKLAEAAAYSML